jgi:hypothetical protein
VYIASSESTDEAFNVSLGNFTADKRHFGPLISFLKASGRFVAKEGSLRLPERRTMMAGLASEIYQVLPYVNERAGVVFKEDGMGRIHLYWERNL